MYDQVENVLQFKAPPSKHGSEIKAKEKLFYKIQNDFLTIFTMSRIHSQT